MTNLLRPPCWPEGSCCPNDCAARLYRRVIDNHVELHGAWTGWRLAGVRLVSPHRDWISPQTLDRLLYRRGRLYSAETKPQLD